MSYKTISDITQKQQEIIHLVVKFRFINRKQIQEILGHKDARRINTWLKDLVEKKYLGRIYSHKLLENTKPAIYYLANNGITFMQWNDVFGLGNDYLETKYVKKYYEDKHASETFRNHSLMLCDMYIQLKNHEKTIDWEYEYYTKSELLMLMKHDKDLVEKRKSMPDVHVYKIKKSGEDSTSILLELIDPKVPRYALQYKVNQYLQLHETDWSDYDSIDQKFPKILFILPTKQKLSRLAHFIQEQLDRSYDVEDVEFMLTTYEQVTQKGIAGDIWRTIKEVEQ